MTASAKRSLLVVLAPMLILLSCGIPTPSVEAATPKLSAALSHRNGSPTIRVIPAEDGLTTSPASFTVELDNIALAPAGRSRDGEGHLHLMVDEPCIEAGVLIPKSRAHIHLGDGSGQARLDLAPGAHNICVQVGDGFHTALALQEELLITVIGVSQALP